MDDRKTVKTETKADAINPSSSASSAGTEHSRDTGSAASASQTPSAAAEILDLSKLDPAKRSLIRSIENTDDMDSIYKAFENFKVSRTSQSGSNSDSNSRQYEKEIVKRVRKRLSNYKKDLDDNTGLRIHYWEKQAGTGDRDYSALMSSRFGTKYQCAGTHGANCPNSIDQRIEGKDKYLKTFKSFQFDHTYTQADIHKSVEAAMKRCVEKAEDELTSDTVPSKDNWDLTYLKQNMVDIGLDNPETKVKKYVDGLIRRWIDVDKLREDLYGERLVVRCANCHTKVDEKEDHLPYDENRYYKN